MGIYLSSPDTRKHSINGEGNGTAFGASAMQGWRLNMEDDHITEAIFTKDSSLYAIFDGHGGNVVSSYCADNIIKTIIDKIWDEDTKEQLDADGLKTNNYNALLGGASNWLEFVANFKKLDTVD